MTRRSPKEQKVEKAEKAEKAQRGGQVNSSIDAWIAAVKESPAFKAQEEPFVKDESSPETSLGRYTLANLKDDTLTLPERPKNPVTGLYENLNDANFHLSNGDDIRDEAVSLRIQFDDLITQNPTAYAFMTHIAALKSDMNTDSSIHQTIYIAEQLEYELKTKSGLTGLDQTKMLTEAKNYPLFLLTLLVNTTVPAEKDQGPLLYNQTPAASTGNP
jgi:hypothetical protein